MTTEDLKPTWPPAWARAALGTAVLASLEGGPLHGYGIAHAVSERGFGRPKGGSLYPLLTSLENENAVIAQWEEGQNGPGKRNYVLTAQGQARLIEERRIWHDLVKSLDAPMPISISVSNTQRKKP
ncbi:PadR family transcriptional regulator PadR [Arthrobacter stackebrandtii]|uniref:PadR family transcriptional regulator PadR n=1 Tax=Arthrobacter stackebrandtii TaxID=272161 RepID=A0ABS4YXG2_9MICC|nr:PadR family transcriptional regulator [Arthrobacter stackebrandtii]MBP2413500.1 PadR family transcriptional regulator PadR [Arthrobacter stackebrandtii]PYH00660.1 PadR family transcriptional regulator [Arthrobacter stackebrandtii]